MSTMTALVLTTVGVVLAVAAYLCKKFQRVRRARRNAWKYSRVPTQASATVIGAAPNHISTPEFQSVPQSETDCLVRASSSDDDDSSSEASIDQPAMIQVETELVTKTSNSKNNQKFVEQETDEELLQ